MVLEHIFRAKWLEQKPRWAFFLGIVYSIAAVISARLIFPNYMGIMAVAFTALLVVPTINKLLLDEENKEVREKKFSFWLLLRDHKDIFEIYFYLFMGVFIVFGFAAALMPQAAILKMFAPQLEVAGITGFAFNLSSFWHILINNIIVMSVCLLLSLIYGSSMIFLIWNATVWGAVFGYVARESAAVASRHPLTHFFVTILPVLPHLITEAAAYFGAAVAGGVVSKAVLREKLFSKKFHHVLTDGLLLMLFAFIVVVIAGLIEVGLYPILRF